MPSPGSPAPTRNSVGTCGRQCTPVPGAATHPSTASTGGGSAAHGSARAAGGPASRPPSTARASSASRELAPHGHDYHRNEDPRGGEVAGKQLRTAIAALQMSLDGYIQGANGEVDWVDSWNDALDLVPGADAAVIGG